jgi:hypothetical protein
VYKILLSISLLAAHICFGADTASDYFHRGAQFYIWGKKPEAKNEIFTGLKLFPNDAELNGLAGLLKKEEEQQQQQQQQNQQQQQDQSKQDQNQQQQSQQDQQKNDSSQQNQQEQNQKQEQQQKPKPSPSEKQPQQQAAQQAEKSKDDSEQKDNEEAYAAGQMTPEQARQLLDAQKGEEMMLPVKPEGKPTDRRRPVRDW